jgi:hypothetical protein
VAAELTARDLAIGAGSGLQDRDKASRHGELEGKRQPGYLFDAALRRYSTRIVC